MLCFALVCWRFGRVGFPLVGNMGSFWMMVPPLLISACLLVDALFGSRAGVSGRRSYAHCLNIFLEGMQTARFSSDRWRARVRPDLVVWMLHSGGARHPGPVRKKGSAGFIYRWSCSKKVAG